jgi:hypothetical protein
MEIAKGILIPITADRFIDPVIHYGEITALYFISDDRQYGRITFEDLDAIKVSVGEYFPYEYELQPYYWILKVENSSWLNERFKYYIESFKNNYEYCPNPERLNDFSHYIIRFNNQFVEVIAKGFWVEQDRTSFFGQPFGQPLQYGHPFLPLPETNLKTINAHNLTCLVRKNPKSKEELISDARFCSQKLMEFTFNPGEMAFNTLTISYRAEKLVSILKGYFFGRKEITFDGIATLDNVKPYVEKYLGEFYEQKKWKINDPAN